MFRAISEFGDKKKENRHKSCTAPLNAQSAMLPLPPFASRVYFRRGKGQSQKLYQMSPANNLSPLYKQPPKHPANGRVFFFPRREEGGKTFYFGSFRGILSRFYLTMLFEYGTMTKATDERMQIR